MKPLELTIQGLHSFREKQTVDFETLCKSGVFGIFGPTGSGKSSILDAMTLSLYGKVERAPSNTQGILNHAENQLAVSFTFSLGKHGVESIFKAERTFKRTKDNSLRQATARLIDLTNDSVVIADKAQDVTKEVEKLLGLSIDDFTRAVVLPQGKFSEFLSLKGTERRKMLQRLFHLEKYGDELNHKLKQRLTNENHKKELIEAEQTALGDASKEAVEKAKEQVDILDKQIELEKHALTKAEKEYDTAKKLKEQFEQLTEIKEERNKLEERQGYYEQLKLTILSAKEANILYPYVKEVKESHHILKGIQAELETVKEEADTLKLRMDKCQQAYDAALTYQQKEEFSLKMKLENMKTLSRKVDHLNERISENNQLSSEINELVQQEKSWRTTLETMKSKKTTYEKAQDALKQELSTTRPTSEEKRVLYKAKDAKQRLNYLKEQLNESLLELNEKVDQQKQADKEKTETEKKALDLTNELSESFKQLRFWYDQSRDKKKQTDTIIQQIEDLERSVKDKQQTEAIKALRNTLEEGQACPVCGSLHHTINTQKFDEIAVTTDVSTTHDIEVVKRDVNQIEKQLNEYCWSLDKAAQQSPIVPSQEVTDYYESGHENKTLPHVNDRAFNDQWSQWKKRWGSEQEAIEHVLHRWQENLNKFTSYHEKLSAYNQLLNQFNTQVLEAQEKVADKRSAYEEDMHAWETIYPQIVFTEVETEFQKLQEREEQAEVIRQRLDKSVSLLEKLQEDIEETSDKLQHVTIELSKKQSIQEEKKALIKEITNEIDIATGGKDVKDLIKRYEEDLHQIERATIIAKENMDEATKLHQKTVEKVTQLTHSIEEANNRFERANVNIERQLEESSFAKVEEVDKHLRDNSAIHHMEGELSTYEHKQRDLQLQEKQIQEKIKDKRFSHDTFRLLEEQCAELKQRLEDSRTAYGAAKHHLQELTDKMVRFQSLETKRQETSELVEQLTKLDKVFRGKEFVEFIAEEQLIQVSRLASERLKTLTRGRYAIEVDSTGGFIMRDDLNGGVKRPVTSLSGGETFLTSLALALSLSASIQLKGEHNLEFFFLDEGFGTLDPHLLETVVTALEQLHTTHLSVGVISHVPELKERLPRKLIVTSAEPGGSGSKVKIENL
ncbi:AAA family ATPase [Salipaludibacillus agaradhaerens]|uniref:AAA family ATPase n=1 Tax=Salipaludibacillus agaradhaerens TaxID=76935 RepID=UPI0009982739|nr:SMC family ATPase [Salipaludibacillus agaradhaerens]